MGLLMFPFVLCMVVGIFFVPATAVYFFVVLPRRERRERDDFRKVEEVRRRIEPYVTEEIGKWDCAERNRGHVPSYSDMLAVKPEIELEVTRRLAVEKPEMFEGLG